MRIRIRGQTNAKRYLLVILGKTRTIEWRWALQTDPIPAIASNELLADGNFTLWTK